MKIFSTYRIKTGKIVFASFAIISIIAFSVFYNYITAEEQVTLNQSPVRRPGCTCPLDRNLPIAIINTSGIDINQTPKKVAETFNDEFYDYEQSENHRVELLIYQPENYGYTCICSAGIPTLKKSILISLRGQTSLEYPKKQYTLTFDDRDGFAQPESILGMPSHSKWVLNGSFADKSLVRNAVTFQTAQILMEYSPRYEYCELLVNNDETLDFNNDYQGVYLFTEKIERSPERVDISKTNMSFNDVSFIIARDKAKIGESTLGTYRENVEHYLLDDTGVLTNMTSLISIYPSDNNIIPEFSVSIVKYLNDFEDALWSNDFDSKRNGYRSFIDENSFIELAMINEVFKNVDGGNVSTYFYKDYGAKLKAGPVWDFDTSLGQDNSGVAQLPTGMCIVNTAWFSRLFQDEYFANQYIRRYKNLRNTVFSYQYLCEKIDENAEKIGADAIARNNARWYDSELNYQQEIDQIKSFLFTRLNWLDGNIGLVKRLNEKTIQ